MKTRHFSAILALLWLLMACPLTTFSQQEVELNEDSDGIRGWNISAGFGTSIFMGDVKTNPLLPALRDQNELRYVAMLAGERRFNPWIGSRLHFAYSHVVGTKKPWDVHFQSYVWEAGLTALFYPVNLFSEYNSGKFADFYIMAGIGGINYNAKLYQYSLGTSFEVDRRGYGHGRGIGGTTLSGSLMGGIGADFRLSDNFDLRFEIAMKSIDNDLLDMWKANFPYDTYNHITLGLVYKLGQRGGGDLAVPPSGNQGAVDLWSNVPPKTQEKKDELPQNIQLTPIIEVPAEPEKVVTEKEVNEPEQSATVIVLTETPAETPEPEPKSKAVPANEFRVQIFAAKKPFSKSTLAKRFKLSESEIAEDQFEKYYIYSVGSFSTMEEAMALRDKLRRENGVSDAFVTIWENGQRTGPRF